MSFGKIVLPWNDEFQVEMAYINPFLPSFDPQSADDAMPFEPEYCFGSEGYRASSRHRLTLLSNQVADCSPTTRLLSAEGGASGVHEASAFIFGDIIYAAVGPFVGALRLPTFDLIWHTEVDDVTCFGLQLLPTKDGFISHGEMTIARLDFAGKILWSGGGKDIFTGEFKLCPPHHAEVFDFNDEKYRFDLETGRSEIVPPKP